MNDTADPQVACESDLIEPFSKGGWMPDSELLLPHDPLSISRQAGVLRTSGKPRIKFIGSTNKLLSNLDTQQNIRTANAIGRAAARQSLNHTKCDGLGLNFVSGKSAIGGVLQLHFRDAPA